MITTPGHALTFGGLDLLGADHTAGWWIEATGEDADFGNPEPVIHAVTSFLMDGSVERTESYGNREMTLRVRLTATTSANLAAAEAALVAEVGIRNTMTWTPPDNTGDFAGTASVFEVANSSLAFDLDDIRELSLKRIYVLTIRALPHARAADLVTVATTAPIATTPVNTLVDAGTSLTNWAVSSTAGGFGSPALVLESSTIIRGSQGFPKSTAWRWVSIDRTSLSASMTATPFLRLKMTMTLTGGGISTVPPRIDVIINGTLTPAVAQDGDYYWYTSPVSTITTISIKGWGKFPTADGSILVRLDEAYRTDASTLSSTTGQRQQFLNLTVSGSVRTQGNLVVQNATTALGSVLVYTSPVTSLAAQPPLRRLRTAGSTETTDSATVSGKYSALTTLHTFDIPAANVPLGGYALMARIRNPSGTAYSITWAGKSRQGSNTLDANPPTGVTAGTLTGSNTWNVVALGHMTLPTFRLGPSGLVRIELQSAGAVDLDEAWLFNLDEGRLTVAECGTASPAAGASSNYLFIDAPALATPYPSVTMGTASDRSDAYGAGEKALSMAQHEFTPTSTNVFVVTTNSAATFLSLSYYPRFHTHVA